ncbi:MAG: GGDEF domain-containing protein [Magnetococcales bacterium]|nr:GGDEF domain-containing protein [Magnetococcales bacterium]
MTLSGTTTKFTTTELQEALESVHDCATEKPAVLVVISGDFKSSIFELHPGVVTIGRSADNTIFFECDGVSRHHLRVVISEDAETVTMEDLGSRNGTWLNNARLDSPSRLKKGDIIVIGRTAFKFLPCGDPERLVYDRLRQEANLDGLTRCFNKSYFNHAVDLEMRKSKKTGHPLSLIMFDLDHFKALNDGHGHDAGDYVLEELADIIRARGIREQDIFSRYGGEEFVILLPRTQFSQALLIAERFRKLIEDHDFIYDGTKLAVTASVGVADCRPDVLTGSDLFKRADAAMYLSKMRGRNRISSYEG